MIMPRKLNKIPCSIWVRKTIEKMYNNDEDSPDAWAQYWADSYYELGGKSENIARKGCPRCAAYALWQLGRIKESSEAFRHIPIKRVIEEFGRNATYAMIALLMFEQSWSEKTGGEIWDEVRMRFERDTGLIAAKTEQGVVKLAKILFEEHQVVISGSA
jgi:hypothetical protein